MKQLLGAAAALFLAASVSCSLDGPTYFGRRPDEPFGVAIASNSFFPSQLDLPRGSRVVWTNQDSAAHAITSGTPDHPTGVFNQRIEPGTSFSFTFTEAGNFEFFCSIHPTMRGAVVVK